MKILGLHGAGSTPEIFDRRYHLTELASEFGYTAVLPESKDPKSGWGDDDDEDLLAYVDGDESALVWGQSSGGFKALELALRYPDTFPRVCALAAGIPSREAWLVTEAVEAGIPLPEVLFVTPENDSVVWVEGGVFLEGGSYLGSLDSAKLLARTANFNGKLERIDMIDPKGEGFLPEMIFSRAYQGAETSCSRWDGGHELRLVRNANHIFYLGPKGARSILSWLMAE